MDPMVLEWILQHAMKHSYLRVIKEVYKFCPEAKYGRSLQEFISYVACSKFCLKKRQLQLNLKKILWHSLRRFIDSIPQIPVDTLSMCLQLISILKWIIAVETTLSKQSWPISADVFATLSNQNQMFEKMWNTLTEKSPLPFEGAYRKVKLKLACNNSTVTIEYQELFQNMMVYIISCLDKCLEAMRSCLPITAIEEVQHSKVLHPLEDITVLPANPWERFNCVHTILKKDSSEKGLLYLLTLLLANPSKELNRANEEKNSLHSCQNSSKMSHETTKAMDYKRRISHCERLFPSPLSPCQRKQPDSSLSIDQKNANAYEGPNPCTSIEKPSKDQNLSIDHEKAVPSEVKNLSIDYKNAVSPEMVENPPISGLGKNFNLKGGKVDDVPENMKTFNMLIELKSPTGACTSLRQKMVRKIEDFSDDDSVIKKKFASGGESSDRPTPCVGSNRRSITAEAKFNKKSASPVIFYDERELKVVEKDKGDERRQSEELEVISSVVSCAGTASNPIVKYTVDNLSSDNEVENTLTKTFRPINEKEDGCLVTALPENEINFTCSIEYPSDTNETSDDVVEGGITSNVIVTENLKDGNELEGVGTINILTEGEHNFSCTPNSQKTGVEVNAAIQEMEVDKPDANERLDSEIPEVSANTERQTSVEASPRLGDCEGSSIPKGDRRKMLAHKVNPLLEEEEDGCVITTVPIDAINFTCSVEYCSQGYETCDQNVENVIGTENVNVGHDVEKEGSVVAETEVGYSFSLNSCSQSSDLGVNINIKGYETCDQNVENVVIGTENVNVGHDVEKEGSVVAVSEGEYTFSLNSCSPSPDLGENSNVQEMEIGKMSEIDRFQCKGVGMGEDIRGHDTEEVIPSSCHDENSPVNDIEDQILLAGADSAPAEEEDRRKIGYGSQMYTDDAQKHMFETDSHCCELAREEAVSENVVTADKLQYSCTPCSSRSDSEMNVTVQEKDANLQETALNCETDLEGGGGPKALMESSNVVVGMEEVTNNSEKNEMPEMLTSVSLNGTRKTEDISHFGEIVLEKMAGEASEFEGEEGSHSELFFSCLTQAGP